jgi:hypothetical protein
MEMQYKLETGKMATMANLYIPVSQAISPTDDPQIQRTRKKLMRFFSVSIVSFFYDYSMMIMRT